MTDVVASRAWDRPAEVVAGVVVATHNRSAFIPALLAALSRQSESAYDVVVVDDASTDDTWPTLTRLVGDSEARVLAVRLDTNSGPAAARNTGVSHTAAPVVAFTDDDCVPQPGWLDALVAATESAAVVQGRTVPDPAPAEPVRAWDRSLRVDAVTWRFETCNIAYLRAAFDAGGGFREVPGVDRAKVGGHFGEDAMLGHQVVAASGAVVFAPDALVHHRWLRSTYADHVAAKRRLVAFPALVRHAPSVRRGMWRAPLLTRRSATADLALGGAAVAAVTTSGWPALLAVPWVVTAWPHARSIPGPTPWRLAQLAAADVVGAAALVAGSVKHRTAVL